MCTAKGSDVRPGVSWVSASFAWQAWDNVHRQGVGYTPWRPLGLRLVCVAGVAQCALPRGRMYALASLGSPPRLRGRRGTMCTAKGSDVRPGVPWVSAAFAWQAWHNVSSQGVGCTPWRPLGLRLFCVAGVGQCAPPRGRMYALASLGSPPRLRGRRGTMCTAKGSDVHPGVPWVSAAFAWQAWDNVHCQGVGCTPWRPLGLRRFCVAGVGQCALPRGRMYALASLGSPPLLRGRRGTMCTAKGSDVRPGVPWVSASFAWQAWHNVHRQGVGCTLWRPLGLRLVCVAGVAQCALPRGRMYALASLGSPPLLRGRRGTMCTAKGSDVRPGVPWVSAAFAWQAWHNVHCQGVGCTPWRPLGLRLFCVAGVGPCALPRGWMYALASLGSPPLLRGRRGTMCTAKGSDVRPGVPWVSASFAWQAWHNVHCQGVGCTPHSLTHSLPHSLTHFTSLHFTSLHFTSLHFTSLHFTSLTPSLTHSLTYIIIIIIIIITTTIIIIIIITIIIIIIIIIIMCQRCLPATGHAERDHKMCGCARKSAEHYFGQRKYGEHTIVLIVCRKKTSEPGGTR